MRNLAARDRVIELVSADSKEFRGLSDLEDVALVAILHRTPASAKYGRLWQPVS